MIMKLRDYQNRAVEGILKAWENCRKVLVVLPTGCGKTIVLAEVIRRLLTERPGHAMVLAHREELVTQAADKIAKVTGFECEIEMGERVVVGMMGEMPPVVVSSVQTQNSGNEGEERMRRFNPKDYSVLIIDEAHHATSPTYKKSIGWFLENNPDCRLLGVTATPDRADELALGSVFEQTAAVYDVADAIRDGWLVPIEQKLVTVGTLDFSKIKVSSGDFTQGELAEVMEDERNLHEVAAPVLEILKDKRAIIFAATVKQAEKLAEIINRGGLRADSINGKTPKDERRQKLQDFREGRIQFMVNVGVLTEGFDDAGVEAVVMARPTKSRALYAQMIGRATRPAAEIAAKLGEINSDSSEATLTLRREMIAKSSKPSCLVLDFAGNSGRHKLMTAADILGGKMPEEVIEAVKAKAKRESVDILTTLEELKAQHEEIERRKQAEAEKRKGIRAVAPYCLTKVNPFEIYDMVPVPVKPDEPPRHLSVKQRSLLREAYSVDGDRIPYAPGKQLVDEHFRRKDAGLASYKQTRYLRRLGIVVPMGFEEAIRAIGRRTR